MEPLTRRRLGALSLGALGAFAAARLGAAAPGKNGAVGLIVLWLRGGPSQIETFDPKPNSAIGGPTRAIDSSVKGIQLAAGMPQTAAQMDHLSLVRSVVGQEGDHERASILMKTGRRPEVALTHPSLGAVCAHELPVGETEIPRYVSISSADRTSRGGYLGQAYDPFLLGDPADPIQDVRAPVDDERQRRRLEDLAFLEDGFARDNPMVEARTRHADRTSEALETMRSPQLEAFDIDSESAALRQAYGDNAFGRGCLVARRLIEVGVRCVEVTLDGWDTHVDNFDAVRAQTRVLDPALATLVSDLRERDLWRSTVVLCTGEFGRTPIINAADGRDHWPTGFSLALGGGPLRGGIVVGETSNTNEPPKRPASVADVYATVLAGVGLSATTENQTSLGRPVKLGEGTPIAELLA
jgi:hypothetical protein